MNPGRGVEAAGDNRVHARGDTMKAIVQDRYGSPDVLELREIDRPVNGMTMCLFGYTRPGSIRASGMRWRDCRICSGSRASACARPRTPFLVTTWRGLSRRLARR